MESPNERKLPRGGTIRAMYEPYACRLLRTAGPLSTYDIHQHLAKRVGIQIPGKNPQGNMDAHMRSSPAFRVMNSTHPRLWELTEWGEWAAGHYQDMMDKHKGSDLEIAVQVVSE